MTYAKMLIGREITIPQATDESLIGVAGRIIDESKNMLLVEKSGSKRIRVPKASVSIRMQRPNQKEFETLAGKDLIGTPVERIYKY